MNKEELLGKQRNLRLLSEITMLWAEKYIFFSDGLEMVMEIQNDFLNRYNAKHEPNKPCTTENYIGFLDYLEREAKVFERYMRFGMRNKMLSYQGCN